MSAWNKELVLKVDVEKHVDPLLRVDAGSQYHFMLAEPVSQGVYPVKVSFYEVSPAGVGTIKTLTSGDVVTLQGMRQNLRGDSLVACTLTRGAGEVWTGTLDANTIELVAALGTYDKMFMRWQLRVVNSSGATRRVWQWNSELYRDIDADDPTTNPSTLYYTAAESDALFARKDGPTGYATKLVTISGSLYWAQLVGSTWVVPLIIEVGGRYTQTFVEVT